MKKVVAACIDQILMFDSEKEFEVYEENLKRKHVIYAVKQVDIVEEGKCIVRVKRQYNNNDFMG